MKAISLGFVQMSNISGQVSSVVVNYNAGNYLLDCVGSLYEQGIKQIIVVDNNSSDNSQLYLKRKFPDIELVEAGANIGYGAAINMGSKLVTSLYMLICNPDIILQQGSIESLLETIESDPTIAFVGPKILNPDGTLYPSVRVFPSMVDAIGHAFVGLVAPNNRFSRRYRMLDWDHSATSVVDWVSGACLLANKAHFDVLGGFDESYFMYMEDVDICWRAAQEGNKVVYNPSSRVMHVQGVSSRQHPYKMTVEHHRSLYKFFSKIASKYQYLLLPIVGFGLVIRTVLAVLKHFFSEFDSLKLAKKTVVAFFARLKSRNF